MDDDIELEVLTRRYYRNLGMLLMDGADMDSARIKAVRATVDSLNLTTLARAGAMEILLDLDPCAPGLVPPRVVVAGARFQA